MTAAATPQLVKTANGVTAPAASAPKDVAPPQPPQTGAPPPTDPAAAGATTVPPTPEPPEPPKAPAIDPQREAMYRARERQLQTDKANLRREQEAWQQQQSQRAPLEQQLVADPIAVLSRVWNVDRATAEQHLAGRLLNKGQPQPTEEVAQLRQQVQALTRSIQERDQREQAQAKQQTLEQSLTQFVEMARSSADTHPWVHDATVADAKRIKSHCLRIAREDPTLTDAEILDRIEDELSFAGKLRRDATTTPPATSPPGTATTPPAPTLTSAPGSQSGTVSRSILRMSPEERLKAGIAAVQAAKAKLGAK